MDVRALAPFSILFLTAWTMPAGLSKVDFRASLRPRPVILNNGSPAFAAVIDSQTTPSIAASEGIIAQRTLLKTGHRLNRSDLEIKEQLIADRSLAPVTISKTPKVDHLKELIASVDETPPTQLSLNEYAEILVKEELAKRDIVKKEAPREIVSSTGNTILIAKASVASAPNKPGINRSAPIFNQSVSVKPTRIIAARGTVNLERHNPVVLMAADVQSGTTVTGPLTFAKGAALLSGRQELSVRHVIDGITIEEGSINIPDASYRISVARLEGEIVAEVHTRDGQLLARAEASINDVVSKYGGAARIKNIPLVIEPAFSSLQGEVVSWSDINSKKFVVPQAHFNIAGLDREIPFNKTKKLFVDETLIAPSSFIARATSSRSWPSITMGQSGRAFQIQILPNKLIEALLGLTLEKYKAREALEQGLIWGRISMGEQPVAGAQVRIVGETEKHPIYINGPLPDKTTQFTTPSGVYAFSMLEPGEKMLRVNLGEKLYWPTLWPVDAKTVTFADLKILPRHAVVFRSTEAFSQKPLAAQMSPLGTEERYMISSQTPLQLNIDTVSGFTYVEAQTDDQHENVRTQLRENQSEMTLSFVKKDFIRRAKEHLGLKNIAESGSAVVFVNGDEYEVTMGAGSELKDKNIVYFDANGKFIDQPVDDGGFVVLNEARGFNAVTIIPQKSKRIITRQIYFDQYAIATENINLTY
jgi:hypothetical protein